MDGMANVSTCLQCEMVLVVTAGAGANIEADLQLRTLKIGVVVGVHRVSTGAGQCWRWAQ